MSQFYSTQMLFPVGYLSLILVILEDALATFFQCPRGSLTELLPAQNSFHFSQLLFAKEGRQGRCDSVYCCVFGLSQCYFLVYCYFPVTVCVCVCVWCVCGCVKDHSYNRFVHTVFVSRQTYFSSGMIPLYECPVYCMHSTIFCIEIINLTFITTDQFSVGEIVSKKRHYTFYLPLCKIGNWSVAVSLCRTA